MTKKQIRNIGAGTAIATLVTVLVLNALAGQGWSKTFTPITQGSLWLQANDPVYESVLNNTTHWTCTAGSPSTGTTHYARLRYGLPEFEGRVLTQFYLSMTARLAPNFYDVNTDTRIMNTDNYGRAVGGNELRTSVYITRDGRVHIRSEHQNKSQVEYYVSEPRPSWLSAGEWHTVELYGDLAQAAPWYFRVDGVVIASGVARLSPDSVPAAERVVSRAVWCLDGAYRQNATLVMDARSVTVGDYDLNALVAVTPGSPTTPATITPSATSAPATATRTAAPATQTATFAPASQTPSVTPNPPTATATGLPVAECHLYDGGAIEICVRRLK